MQNPEKKNFKYLYLIIGVLILLFLVYYCSKKPEPQTPDGTTADSTLSVNLPAYYAIDIPMIAQKGSNSCWAATLQMINSEDSILNKKDADSKYLESIIQLLPGYGRDQSRKMNEPSWTKIKQHLSGNKPLVTYKYFDEKFAHVFLVKGYQETPESRWLIVNDPYPVRKGKIAAIAYNQYLRPFNSQINYQNISVDIGSTQFEEPALSLISKDNLQGVNEVLYSPPGIDLTKKSFKLIPENEVLNLAKQQIKLLTNLKKVFFKSLGINYDPANETLKIDNESFLRINQFTNTQRFLKYDNTITSESSYLFDNEKLAFLNFTKNNQEIICNTFEIQDLNGKKTLYLSKFENHKYSDMVQWATIKKAASSFRPQLSAFLNSSQKNQPQARQQNQTQVQVAQPEEEFSDISMLNLPGGAVFSFKWKYFKQDKLVADPFRQLKSKSGQAVFVADGIPFYRLQDIILPEQGELILNESLVKEEWKQDVEEINFSSGINDNGNELNIGSKDPFWKIMERPDGNPIIIPPFAGYWQPSPVIKTNAQWLGIGDKNYNQPSGNYTFSREIIIIKPFGVLDYDFSIAYDDEIMGIQIVSPTGNTKNIPIEGIRNPSPKGYYLGKRLSGSIITTETGNWKIRLKVKFIDSVAGIIVSGKVKTHW